jgi:hypothetical protein
VLNETVNKSPALGFSAMKTKLQFILKQKSANEQVVNDWALWEPCFSRCSSIALGLSAPVSHGPIYFTGTVGVSAFGSGVASFNLVLFRGCFSLFQDV